MKPSRPVVGTYAQRIPKPSVYHQSTAGSILGTTGEQFLAKVTLNKVRILVEGLLRSILYPSMRPPRYPPVASAQQIQLAWAGTHK
ncbi:hypothetical protein PISMIDRAFT_238905 [Pisolithus microcarpus 441]|uniref:Uncharacterized protein n=1 Tax=Pisolithus microcarpus 441 TaxID=765257 RepID=A0A0C9YST6_9AGAM|nr:hypothetical protein PISMIDRAFT_238905 [Pisolithus microcarpus 441]